MSWKERLFAGVMVLAALGVGWPKERQAYQHGYEVGFNTIEVAVANCSLADAKAGKCFIPCGSDTDCVEKNGVEEY